jgi:predicted dehydrogenase
MRTSVAIRPDLAGEMRPCTGEDGFSAIMRTDQGVSATINTTATSPVSLTSRVKVIGREGLLEMVTNDLHEKRVRIVLHSADGPSEVFQMEEWAESQGPDDGGMIPFARSLRDAVRNGEPEPGMPTFADGLACARVVRMLMGGTDGGSLSTR